MQNPDTEEPKIQRADCKVIHRFSTPWRVGAPIPMLFKGLLCNTPEITIKMLEMEKEQEHINGSSCAYAGIVGNCFYNLKNDFFFSLKDLSETLRFKSCQKLNQSLAGYAMNKAG